MGTTSALLSSWNLLLTLQRAGPCSRARGPGGANCKQGHCKCGGITAQLAVNALAAFLEAEVTCEVLEQVEEDEMFQGACWNE